MAAFRQGLSEAGYVEGQNVAIEYRWAEGRPDRLPALAADFVDRKVDVIAASGDAAALAAKSATSTIPIVFFSGGDPATMGLVTSLARLGGNLTGVAFMAAELVPKRLELVSELVPQARVIALLVNPNDPNAERFIGDVQEASHAKGLLLHILRASSESEIDGIFARPTCTPARSSSAPTRSSPADAFSSWRWRHAMPFRRSTRGASSPRPAA
jgi:putative tryptophan/tyrosine transport system substrate-binding protein